MSSAPGALNFLQKQVLRLGFPSDHAHVCRNSTELHTLGGLIGELVTKLKDPHSPGQRRTLPLYELERIKTALTHYEVFSQQLHLMAAAGDAMLQAAYDEFKLERPKRTFEIIAESDFATPAPVAPALSPEDLREAVYAGYTTDPDRPR